MRAETTTLRPATLLRAADWTDEEVVARVLAGEPALFEVLMRRHNQQIYRVARAILRDEDEVDDVLQDAYLAAYRQLARFERRARFSTWLTRIAANHAIDRCRRRSRTIALRVEGRFVGALNGTPPPDPEQQRNAHELGRLLERAIDALPERYRVVYVLREVQGLDTREAAACLGIEEATAKTRLHRARALLREDLGRDPGALADRAFPFGGERCDRLAAATLGRLFRLA